MICRKCVLKVLFLQYAPMKHFVFLFKHVLIYVCSNIFQHFQLVKILISIAYYVCHSDIHITRLLFFYIEN